MDRIVFSASDIEAHMPRVGRVAIVTGGEYAGSVGTIGWMGEGPKAKTDGRDDVVSGNGYAEFNVACRDHRVRVGIDVEKVEPNGHTWSRRIFVNCDKIDVIALIDDDTLLDYINRTVDKWDQSINRPDGDVVHEDWESPEDRWLMSPLD